MKLYNWEEASKSADAFTSEPKLWEGVRALPTLPSSLFKFLGLVGDSHRSIDDIVDFVCQDPALLARVLPLISECFTSPDPASATLRESIKGFGRERIRALASITPLIRSFEPVASGSYATTLWERSISTANAAQATATYLQLPQPERYYVAGLLHDIGYMLVLQKSPTLFAAAVRRWIQRPAGLLELEAEIFGENHCEIGVRLARQLNLHSWYFPAIQHHHTPRLDEDQVSTVVTAAAAFCSWQGIDIFPKQVASPNSFSGGYRVREARTREIHEVLRGLFPQLQEIEHHRLLEVMATMVRPVRAAFEETFAEWYTAGESWMRPYRYTRRSESVAAVA
jgi:putative nucleotidyltransferase with HDIG domain